jgi:uncharacterized protein (DUF427 family)
VSEELDESQLDGVGDDVLPLAGLAVRLVPGEADDVDEKSFSEPMTTDDRTGALLALCGEDDAPFRRFQIALTGEPVDHLRDGLWADAETLNKARLNDWHTLFRQAEDRLQVLLDGRVITLSHAAQRTSRARRHRSKNSSRCGKESRSAGVANGMTARAMWNDTVIAESDETVIVEGNHYFPPTAVRRELLTDSETTSICPWKGTASYYSLVVDGDKNEDAVWYYPEPFEVAGVIKDYVAFWHGVTVTADEGDGTQGPLSPKGR